MLIYHWVFEVIKVGKGPENDPYARLVSPLHHAPAVTSSAFDASVASPAEQGASETHCWLNYCLGSKGVVRLANYCCESFIYR